MRCVPVVLATLLLGANLGTAAENPVKNADFEDGDLGEVPDGWFFPPFSANAGYKARLSDDRPKNGKRCALLIRDAKDNPRGFGNLMQSFDATPFRGKRVRLRASVRADGRAQLWLRVDCKDNKAGFFNNMGDRPIVKKEWNDYEIVGDVADDAESINLGMMLIGNGRAWFDAVSLEVLGKLGEGNEPPRPFKGRSLDNVVAFTRLLGYVRYFHPSDEAATTNWEAFAIDGVAAVEGAGGPAELARTLDNLFRPIAPTVRIFATGGPPPEAPELAAPKDASVKVLAWRHLGVGTGDPHSIYSSKRISEKDASKNDKVALFPRVKEPFAADFGAGLSCLVPLALYADGKGRLPRGTAAVKALSSKPKGFAPNGKDRATRLAAVALAWNVFQHFYPYFDVVKADWPAALRAALAAAATDESEAAFHITLRRLVAGLQDGHGFVAFASAQAPLHLPIRWDWIEDRLVVTRVTDGAEGVKPGDVVVKVNGKAAADVLADQEKLIAGATPQWRRYRALAEIGQRQQDTEITLEVLPPSGKAREVRLRRSLDFRTLLKLQEPRPEKVEEIKPGIVYADLGRLTDKEFEEALPKLEKAKGIVFDLRGYPRLSTAPLAHLTDQTVQSAQWHVPVTYYPDRKDVTFERSGWPVQPKEPRLRAKAAFLTDGQAISYAETYLGIVEHYKLAEIVGSPTAGTNGNVNPFSLPGGYRLSWTGMKVLKHDGSQHHGVGIRPTVPVARTIKGVLEGRDEVLEKAIETVSR